MDRIQQMHVFARVAETQSFTRAAEGLGLSRATVSVSVRQLESRLGVRLLHRTTRHVGLTPEGRLFLERCHRILSDIEETEQFFQQRSAHLEGTLTIDVPARIANRILIPALPDFLARHPGLKICLGASDRVVNLVEKGVDLALRIGALTDSTLVAKRLGTLAQINCASPGYIARYGQPLTLDALDEHLVVNYSPTLGGAGAWGYVADGVAQSRPVKSAVTVSNAEAYIACALAGLGLIQIPAYDVRHHIESGALIPVLPNFVSPPMLVSVLYPTRRHIPPRVRAFVDWLTTLLRHHNVLAPAD